MRIEQILLSNSTFECLILKFGVMSFKFSSLEFLWSLVIVFYVLVNSTKGCAFTNLTFLGNPGEEIPRSSYDSPLILWILVIFLDMGDLLMMLIG